MEYVWIPIFEENKILIKCIANNNLLTILTPSLTWKP
jgi:hypothetical protein